MASALKYIAAGEGGDNIWYKAADEAVWSAWPTGLPAPYNTWDIFCVAASSLDDVYVFVHDYGTTVYDPVVLHWDGSAWTDLGLSVGATLGTSCHEASSAKVINGNLYFTEYDRFVVDTGGVWKYDGTSFTLLADHSTFGGYASPSDFAPGALDGAAETGIWIFESDSGGNDYLSRWNGTAWDRHLSVTVGTWGPRSLSVLSGADAYIASEYNLKLAHWDDVTWTDFYTSPTHAEFAESVYAAATGEILLVGRGSFFPQTPVVRYYDGSTWTDITPPVGTRYARACAGHSAANAAIVGGIGGLAYILSWDGTVLTDESPAGAPGLFRDVIAFGGTTAMGHPLYNRSFEDPGLQPGQADWWTEDVS